MNNTNTYYGLCGFLSGGILVFLFNNYKIHNLEKKINELEKINENLVEHLILLDSTPCNSSHKKESKDKFKLFETISEDDITE